MSIRGSNGDFHATLLSMLAEMKRDGKRADQRIAVLERRAELMEIRMEAFERRMKKADEQLNRTARILAGVGEALKSLDRRVASIESGRA